jgi:hypothetical protein
MGRKKSKTLGFFALQAGFGGFREEDVSELEEALGHPITPELRTELQNEISGWLMRFGDYRRLGYGAKERRLVASAQRAAAQLHLCLRELGELADAGLDHFTYAQRITNDQFMAVLSKLDQFESNLERLVDDKEIDVGAIQIQMLGSVLVSFGIDVTVSTKNYVTTYNPSAFTRFVDRLWCVEPRLRMFHPRGADYWDGLSQWIGIQLRKPDTSSALANVKLLRRAKLK